MTVQTVTSIPGKRGTICLATGKVERGVLSYGDEVLLIRQGVCVRRTTVPCIESSGRLLIDRAESGTTVSLYLPETITTDVKRGDVVLGISAEPVEKSEPTLWA